MKMRASNLRQAAKLLIRAVACIAVAGAVVHDARSQTSAIWRAVPVSQSNGSVTKMPLKHAASRSNNLSLSIDTRWSQNYGYRPVKITVTSPKALTNDRLINVRLHSGWNGQITAEQEFTLPAGSAMATIILRMPQYQAASPFYWWEVRVDGFLDRDLSLRKEEAFLIAQGGYASISGLSFLSMSSSGGQRTLLSPMSMEFEVLSLSAAEFPDRWIDYTCFDSTTLSLDDLLSLKSSNPAAFAAMQDWIRAGGHLWVNNVGDQFERLPELSELLRLRESVSSDVELGDDSKLAREPAGDTASGGWRPLRFINGNIDGQVVTFLNHGTGELQTVRDAVAIAKLQADPNYSVASQRYENTDNNVDAMLTGDSGEWFIEQPLGLGMVRAFRDTNDVSQFQQLGPVSNTTAMHEGTTEIPPSLRAALDSVGRWTVRHGTAPDDANYSFSDLLVPGMGLAPVTEFEVLITLFVLVIGPLNYWLLKRWRRLHLMVLTVPLAAAIVTLALFTYAVISDGFATTVRVNSYTTIDQRTGDSACWAWLSYYSGLAPRGGLVMPGDVAMYPVVPDWSSYAIDSFVNVERDLKWLPDEAKLTRGWLRSRTPTQYLTIRARKSPIRLELTPVRDRMRARNSLGTPIDFVAVIDDAGKYWVGAELNDKSLTFLDSVDKDAAVARFRKFVTDRTPQTPDELVGRESQGSTRRRWQRMRSRSYAYGGNENMESNLANLALADLAGLAGKEGLALPPRSYVAVTETGPEVAFGMDGVEEQASFHVLVGQW